MKRILFDFNEHDITAIEYKAEPLFIAREIEPALNCPPGRFMEMIRENAAELPEGSHVVRFEGDELASFKFALPADSAASRARLRADLAGTQSGPSEVVGGRGRSLVLLTEPGLCRALILVGGPKALAFRDWLDGEVLPELRALAVPSKPVPLAAPPEGPLAELPARVWVALLAAEAALGHESEPLRQALSNPGCGEDDAEDWQTLYSQTRDELARTQAEHRRERNARLEAQKAQLEAVAESNRLRLQTERLRKDFLGLLVATRRDEEGQAVIQGRLDALRAIVHGLVRQLEGVRRRRQHYDDLAELMRLLHDNANVHADTHPRQIAMRLGDRIRWAEENRAQMASAAVLKHLDIADQEAARLQEIVPVLLKPRS
jgi:prophage antirepressor-like protein